MTPETTQTSELLARRHSRTARIVGHVLASISLLPFVIFWADFFNVNATEQPGLPLTNSQGFTIMGIAVILATIAFALRSKLWLVERPVSLLMFFFTMAMMRSWL